MVENDVDALARFQARQLMQDLSDSTGSNLNGEQSSESGAEAVEFREYIVECMRKIIRQIEEGCVISRVHMKQTLRDVTEPGAANASYEPTGRLVFSISYLTRGESDPEMSGDTLNNLVDALPDRTDIKHADRASAGGTDYKVKSLGVDRGIGNYLEAGSITSQTIGGHVDQSFQSSITIEVIQDQIKELDERISSMVTRPGLSDAGPADCNLEAYLCGIRRTLRWLLAGDPLQPIEGRSRSFQHD